MAKTTVVEHDGGVSWVVAEESMQRAGHAVGDAGGVWLIDPLDAHEDTLARARAVGPVRGVIQLLDRHERACKDVAAALGLGHERLPERLPDSPLRPFKVLGVPGWREVGLWWPGRRVLVVAEAIGTCPYYRFGPGKVGVHPFLRLVLPSATAEFDPLVFLPGHGFPVTGADTAAAVRRAHANARRDLVHLPAKAPKLLRDFR